MAVYLITSVSLSISGWLIYLGLLRSRGSAPQRKVFLYVLVIGSLLLPFSFWPHLTQQAPAGLAPPTVKWPRAVTQGELQQFCRCEKPNLSHRIHYQTNATYNLLLNHKHWLTYGVMGAVGFTLLFFMLQVAYLYRLVRQATQQPITIAGQPCTLLTPHRPLGIGAFWLGQPYLIWQEGLSGLTTAEREAIYRHEWSHLQQRNTLEKGALRLLQCLWWFNPVLYLLRRELDLLSEMIADEAGQQALPSHKVYAQLLLRLQALRADPRLSPFTGSQLKRRIQALLQPQVAPPRRLYLATGLSLVLQGTLASPLAQHVERTLAEVAAYEAVYQQAPSLQEAIYCQDCETICTPEP